MDCLGTDFTRPRFTINKTEIARRTVSQINYHFSTKSKCCFNLTSVVHPMHPVYSKKSNWRVFSSTVGLDQEDDASQDLSIDSSKKILTPDELNALLVDSQREKLNKKLSEANQYNRFLKRELQTKDDALANFKSELAVLELELQALVGLAGEVINSGIPPISRKINGNYIHSHLLYRLQAVQEKIKEQIKDVDSFKFQEITVYWVGMAESVQIMGSFDGWSNGEDMSREYSGDYGKFSATLKLRPGRYEIKFLVDEEWKLSPEFPTTGEGSMKNNLLIVE